MKDSWREQSDRCGMFDSSAGNLGHKRHSAASEQRNGGIRKGKKIFKISNGVGVLSLTTRDINYDYMKSKHVTG